MTRDQVISLLIELGVAHNYTSAARQLDSITDPIYDSLENWE